MNQNGQDLLRKIFYLTAGAVCGGMAGYMISEVVVDKLLYGHIEPEIEKDILTRDDDIVVGLNLENHKPTRVPYSKAPLADLVRDYGSDEKEPIRIVDKDEVIGNDVELIHFYDGDTVFSYEDGTMIEAPNDLFVPNAHLHFGENDDPDVVYVRNDDVGLYYEIVRLIGSYKEDVLGEIPEEANTVVKKTPVKRSRRAAKPKVEKKDPIEELTDDPHETDGK